MSQNPTSQEELPTEQKEEPPELKPDNEVKSAELEPNGEAAESPDTHISKEPKPAVKSDDQNIYTKIEHTDNSKLIRKKLN